MTESPPPIDYASPGMSAPGGRPGRRWLGWILFIGLAIILFVLLRQQRAATWDISLSEFSSLLRDNNSRVRLVTVEPDELRGELNVPASRGTTNFRVQLTQGMGTNWNFVQWLLDNRGTVEIRCSNSQNLLLQVVLPFVPWLLIFGFVWFFIFRQLKRRAGPVMPTPVVIVNPEIR